MNKIYKIVKNHSTGCVTVVSELAKANKKTLSGKLLALSVVGILASASISVAQADTVMNSNDSGANSLQDILSNIDAGKIVYFAEGINSNNISGIEIVKENITIQGNGSLDTSSTITSILNLAESTRTQYADDYAEFSTWLKGYFQNQIDENIATLIEGQNLTQITVANQSITTANVNGLFYIIGSGNNNNLSVKNLYITTDDNTIEFTGYSIAGGGLIAGVNSSLGDIKSNIFSEININSIPNIRGGGVVGVMNSIYSDLSIGTIENNIFNKNSITISGSNPIQISGGGLIGVYTEYDDTFWDKGIYNNIFNENEVKSSGYITGGGLIGAKGDGKNFKSLELKNISYNLFNKNIISADMLIGGGGLIGSASTSDNSSSKISVNGINNNIFSENNIDTPTIAGGGLIGSYSYYLSDVSNVSNNIFSNNGVNVTTVNGGGIIGTYSAYSQSTMNNISNNVFSNNTVDVTNIYGGGLIGASSSGSSSTIDNISNNVFSNNTITASGNIYGGVIGVSSVDSSSLSNFSGNVFINNEVTASGYIMGGVLYAQGLNDELIISDSIFSNNKVSSSNTIATVIGIDTRKSTENVVGHELTLSASNGGLTYIANHEDNDGDAAIYMGNYNGTSEGDAILNITPDTDGLVALYDSINVNQNNGKAFTMNINGVGDFYWGGQNTITADGSSSVNFTRGRTTLLSGYSLTDNSSNGTVNFNSGSTTLVQLTEEPDNQAPTITANEINVSSGSTFGVNNTFSYSDDILTNNVDRTILTLNASSGNAIDTDSSTLESGKISTGVYDYDYTLTWEGAGTDTAELKFDYIASSKTYNKDLAGSATTMAPGIMVYNLPAIQNTNHYMSNVLRANRTSFATVEREDTNWNLWMTPSYTYTKRSSGGDRIGYDINTYGTTIGFDINPLESNNAVLGFAWSIYQQDFDASHTDVDGTTYLGQIYAGVTLPKEIEVLGNIGYGKVDYDQKRTVKGERLSADFSSNIFFVGTQISKPFTLTESMQLRPFVGYDYLHLSVDSHNEKGNTYNLHSSSYNQDLHRTRLGTELNWDSSNGVYLGTKVFYQNLAGDRKAKTDIYFINDASKTKEVSVGDTMESNSLGLEFSATASLANNLSFEANYQLNKASHTQSHQAKFTLSYAF